MFGVFNPLISIMMILEVMDKMPPLGAILAPVAFAGVSAFFLCLWKPKACIVAFPFCWMIAGLWTALIFEDYIGPAIRSEDPAYWYAAALTALACCLAPFLGSFLSPRRANRSRRMPRSQE